MSYRRLALGDRYQIQAFLASGQSYREVARQLGRSASTISREVGRLKSKDYSAGLAQRASEECRQGRYEKIRKIKASLELYVRRRIEQDWSPEQISGRLRYGLAEQTPSHPTIYEYIERDKLNGGKLWKHLRILRKQRKDRKKPNWCEYRRMPDRQMISDRPAIVENRDRIGDFERDLVHGKFNKAALLTIVDRTSRLVKLGVVGKKSSDEVHRQTVRLLRGQVVHTLTNDNGTEFARHKQTAHELKAEVYFANSYSSHQRGTNENTNGLLRQYFPRRRPIEAHSKREIKRIENLLNNRPRKCLGYKTPLEVHRDLNSLGVALKV